MLHKQKFAINLVATPSFEESFFSDAAQAKVCNKSCGNSIFWGKFFSDVTQAKVYNNFFFANPFFEEIFFSDATQAKVCNKFCGNSIFWGKFFFLMPHKHLTSEVHSEKKHYL